MVKRERLGSDRAGSRIGSRTWLCVRPRQRSIRGNSAMKASSQFSSLSVGCTASMVRLTSSPGFTCPSDGVHVTCSGCVVCMLHELCFGREREKMERSERKIERGERK